MALLPTILIRVDATGGVGIFPSSLGMRLRDFARDMPGKRKWKGGTLQFELSRSNIDWVREHLPAAAYDNPARLRSIMDLEIMEAAARRAKVVDLPPEASAFLYKTKPRDHQRKTFMISRDRKVYGLWLEQGLGKSKIIIDNSAYLWAEGSIDTLLIIAPNDVHAQWVDEQMPAHMPDWANAKCIVYQSNHTKKWLAEADAVLSYTGGLRVVSINIEALSGPKGVAFLRRVLTSCRCMWALDESTGIKTPGKKRTKAALKLSTLAPYRRTLSGTPVTKGVEDLYTQLKFLSDDITGLTTFTEFRNHYCVTTPNPFAPGAVRIVGYKNIEELQRRMDAHCMRLTVDDCLDLPPMNYLPRYVQLTDEQKHHYKEVRDQLITQLSNGAIVSAEQAVVKLLRLQQIICGHVKDELGATHRIPSHRAAEAVAAADQAHGKVVVWARFREDITILMEVFTKAGYNPVQYDGRVDKAQAKANKQRFINDPECRAFIANQEKGAIGTDGLQRVAHTMIFFSNSFKAYYRWQAESRLRRDGMAELAPGGTVNAIDLIARGTVDTYLLAVLRQRRDIAQTALTITAAQLDGALPPAD